MYWRVFVYKGNTYDLSHLHPQEFLYIQPARKSKPEREYKVRVRYSSHCFTHRISNEEKDRTELYYPDSEKTRIFDFRRYELSFDLPEIVRSLGERKCYHTNHGNFFTWKVVNADGNNVDYEVYFEIKKVQRSLELYVQSAYIRDIEWIDNRPGKKKISFYVILYNVINNKKIRKPL